MASSGTEDERPAKKRRLPNACDQCRVRKVKCDSVKTKGGRCTNCCVNDTRCTHDIVHKPRGPRVNSTHVVELQRRIQELEAALKARDNEPPTSNFQVTAESTSSSPGSEGDDLEYLEMLDALKKSSFSEQNSRYFGPSSNIYFLRKMMEEGPPVNLSEGKQWTMHPWEMEVTRLDLTFPDEDLLYSLIGLYEKHSPSGIPVLHLPSFRRNVDAGLHYIDDSFGSVVLMVCALGARLSPDPRVLLDGVSWHSAGWKYYKQTSATRISPLRCPGLYDVQSCCLAAVYLLGTSSPQAAWPLVGLAMKYSIELGFHRRLPGEASSENELKKRAFWGTYFLDRHLCFYTGRPCSIHDDDWDVEAPAECDDNYWDTDDPRTNFRQPEGVPSRVAAFTHHTALARIMSFALRSLFSIKRSKSPEELIFEIDSQINEWRNNLPLHLRWDPNRSDDPFFGESASLLMAWYGVQIKIHRTFIHKGTAQSQSSLTICTHAARTMARALDIWIKRYPIVPSFAVHMSAFTTGVILVMNIRRRALPNAQHTAYPDPDVDDLYKVINTLQVASDRYSLSARLIHTLRVLAGLPCPRDPAAYRCSDGTVNIRLPPKHPDLTDLDPSLFGLPPKQEPVEPQLEWSTMDIQLVPLFETQWAEGPGVPLGNGGLQSTSNTNFADPSWNEWNGYFDTDEFPLAPFVG